MYTNFKCLGVRQTLTDTLILLLSSCVTKKNLFNHFLPSIFLSIKYSVSILIQHVFTECLLV